MPSIENTCGVCGGQAWETFGDRAVGDALTWSSSLACEHCGAGIEADGHGALPDDLRSIQIRENGTWGLVCKGDRIAILAKLRAMLPLTMQEIIELKRALPGPLLSLTRAEAQRIANALQSIGATSELVCTQAGCGPSPAAADYRAKLAAEQAADKARQDAELAARWEGLTHRRCPRCRKPCPEFRKTCAFCGHHLGRG